MIQCYPRHIRAAKLCTRGARAWFQHNGLDWNTFLDSGLPASAFLDTKDPLAARVVVAAEKELADG